MAHCIDKCSLAPGVPHTPDQLRVSEEVMRIFGWKPELVESFKGSYDLPGVWLVRVRIGLGRAVRFTFAHGLLLGIFPKKRGQP